MGGRLHRHNKVQLGPLSAHQVESGSVLALLGLPPVASALKGVAADGSRDFWLGSPRGSQINDMRQGFLLIW